MQLKYKNKLALLCIVILQKNEQKCHSKVSTSILLIIRKVLDRSTHVGAGLRYLGQKPSNDTLIGMFSKNRVEVSVSKIKP